ncbi:MAG: hypothetical protein J6B81_05865 [Spirochaetaceae bacterium]|nr:hypothetical protein [Spirochaetaceae bacterium]
MKKKCILCLVLAIIVATSGWAQLFNDKLSAEEQQQLADGKLLIRNIGKAKNISLNPVTPFAKKAIDTIEELDPAYLAEVIQIIPYTGNEHLIESLKPMLLDVQSYVGIPYYSERAEAYYDLYSSAEVKSINEQGSITRMNAILEMEPFGNIDTDIYMDATSESIYYEMTNLNKLRYYDKFTCAREEKMKSIITAFKFGDSIVLYGIGGVDAPSIFFLRDRVETSFMNRIKTFCSYFFAKL